MEVLQEADVICSTLSGAGHETLEQLDFEMVIIDEAAQSIELSSLIPLKFRCQRCIMVGGEWYFFILPASHSAMSRSTTTTSHSFVSGGNGASAIPSEYKLIVIEGL